MVTIVVGRIRVESLSKANAAIVLQTALFGDSPAKRIHGE